MFLADSVDKITILTTILPQHIKTELHLLVLVVASTYPAVNALTLSSKWDWFAKQHRHVSKLLHETKCSLEGCLHIFIIYLNQPTLWKDKSKIEKNASPIPRLRYPSEHMTFKQRCDVVSTLCARCDLCPSYERDNKHPLFM